MAQGSSIEWTDATWNPVAGCTIVSPGCTKCYAMRMAARLEAMGQAKYAGTTKKVNGLPVWTGKINLDGDALAIPLKRRKPTKWFVNSMSDLFHEGVPFEFVDKVFAVMALTPHHTYQILTKRPERMAEYTTSRNGMGNANICDVINSIPAEMGNRHGALSMPLPNVWLGTSVENQKAADERIPHLLRVPAAVRFLSVEPMLGAVNLNEWIKPWLACGACSEVYELSEAVPDPDGHPHGADKCAKCGRENHMLSLWGDEQVDRFESGDRYANNGPHPEDDGCLIDWAIVGGESGHGSRPFNLEWARSIVGQCKAAGVACFVKQLGAEPFDVPGCGNISIGLGRHHGICDCGGMVHGASISGLKLNDPKGGDIEEFPAELRVREFPNQLQREEA